MTDQPDTREDRGAARKVLSARVPLWTLLLAVVAVALVLGAVVVMQRINETSLGPAVAGAQDVDVRIVICNAEVDRRGINPRTAELDLQETLTDHGAGQSQVRIERVDCPTPAGGPAPNGGPAPSGDPAPSG